MDKFRAYIKLMRCYQWVKNLFVFLPMFFAFQIADSHLYLLAFLAFIGLSFIASSIYIINDWCDVEEDKLHPEKKYRPLAAGTVSKKEAAMLLAFLLIGGFFIYVFLLGSIKATIFLAVYLVMNLAYSFKLKHISILDVTIVSIGFVLRLLIGGAATGIALSQWIVIMTFLLALLLALGKRRDDVLVLERTGQKARRNIDGYNLGFTDSAIIMMSGIIVVAYVMYTISTEVIERNGDSLYFTAIFVVLGILRYLQLLFVEEKSGNPTKIFLKDRALHIILIGWVVCFFAISFFYRQGL